ncbi:hypothetical protein ACFYVL_26920 [Streptomyces sp. NPDC004111]|uniref:hypothetical protein n=1 Tax=Streptomyces sp. NPDC004111 TaxID=3364690 RepID=UPI00368BBE40
MRGDEAQETVGGGVEARGRSGPRHAAPRKSLLTKLHMPAGKALALAAMPTAVFVGMSLTPKLAMAAEEPANPFAPGPCVTQPDADADKDAEAKEKDKAEDEAKDGAAGDNADGAKDDAGTKPKDDTADGAKPGTTPAPGATKAPGKPAGDTAPETGGTAGGSTPAPKPTPAETEPKNPLDPLGVGDKIKDFFDGLGGKKEEAPATPAPTTSAPAPKETPAPQKSAGTPAPPAKKAPAADGPAAPKPAADAPKAGDDADTKAEKDAKAAKEKLDKAAEEAEEKAEQAAAKTEKSIREAAEKLGIKVADLDQDGDGKPDLVPNADGSIPFPCPTADPKALADAKLEPGIPDLPDDPWTLETSMLTLRGLNYEGIVEVRTAGGKIKKVLKFTAKETDIKDLHQTTVGPNGTTGHVQARKGSTSTLRQGTVTMYTEELKGNLFGLIPVTFSPETPPPLNVPIAMFTKAKVTQAGQFGGTLTVPGLHNYFTGPGTGQ